MSGGPQSFRLWVLQVLLLSGLLVFFLWLALRPADPTYTLVDFSVPASPGNDTTVSFSLEVSNGNKGGGVFFSDMNVTLCLDGKSVGTTSLPSFYQGHGKTARMAGGVKAGDGRLREAVSKGTAHLKVGLATAVRYRIWRWRSRVHAMEVQASVPVGTDGKVSGERMTIQLRKPRKKGRLRV